MKGGSAVRTGLRGVGCVVYLVGGLVVLGLLSVMAAEVMTDPRPLLGTAKYWLTGAGFWVALFTWYALFGEERKSIREDSVLQIVGIFFGSALIVAFWMALIAVGIDLVILR